MSDFIAGILVNNTGIQVTFEDFTQDNELGNVPQAKPRGIADINFPGNQSGVITLMVFAYSHETTIYAWKNDDGSGNPGWISLDTFYLDIALARFDGWDRILFAEISLGDPPIAVG